MKQEPLVSVVVATYRREQALERALRSLTEQSYRNMEIVLVDDNAVAEWNDKVAQIVARVQEQAECPLVYLVNPENKGSAATRNLGIEAARGGYITFLDDDDVYLPNKIAVQVEAMLESGADYGLTDLDLFDEQDRQIEHRTRDYIAQVDPDSLFGYHLMYHMTGTDTLMFTADYLRKIGGFPPIDVGDEFYLMSQAIMAGGTICYLPGCEVKAYVHTGDGGLSSGESKVRGENALYQYKSKYFDRVSAKQRRYIRMRHHAVLAFAYLRQKQWVPFFKHGVCGFCSAPVACARLLLKGR